MCSNLELFGSYICLYIMMKGLHKLLWLYVAVALIDEFNKLCIGAEGIRCGETVEMYCFVVENCPNLSFEDVSVVYTYLPVLRSRTHCWL